MKIGIHAPISYIPEFEAAGGEAMQIFSGSPYRQFPDKTKIKEMNKLSEKMDIVVHAPYSINPGNGRSNNRFALEQQIWVAEMLGAKYIVVHAGSSLKNSCGIGIEYWRRTLDYLLRAERSVTILIENMAHGQQGNAIGSLGSMEKISNIVIPYWSTNKIGICFDTAHAWAAKENFIDVPIYSKAYIKVIHANFPDSSVEYGSHRDRHSRGLFSKMPIDVFADVINNLDADIAIIERDATIDDCKALRNVLAWERK